jgi:glycosyltransferase involved in cell wall biosynthesis
MNDGGRQIDWYWAPADRSDTLEHTWTATPWPVRNTLDPSFIATLGCPVRVRNIGTTTVTDRGLPLPPDRWVTITPDRLTAVADLTPLQLDLTPMEPPRTSHDDPNESGTDLDWWCMVSETEGFGRQALTIWRHLSSTGFAPRLRPTQYSDGMSLRSDVLEAVRHSSAPSTVAATMSVPYDPALRYNPSPVKIAVTQFETTRIPDYHLECVNDCDALITTGAFLPDIWRESGLKIPVVTFESGIDCAEFPYVERPWNDQFRVLVVAADRPRKNAENAIRMFLAAAGDSDDWALTVRARWPVPDDIRAAADNDPRIQFRIGDLSPQDVVRTYHEHNCLLFPSKGEGVGLPPLEAMATGMEVVCSYNTGPADYLDDAWSWPIRKMTTVPASGPREEFHAQYTALFGDVGDYWLPDEQEGADLLRHCFDAWRSGLGKGRTAAGYVRRSRDAMTQARSFAGAMRQILAGLL